MREGLELFLLHDEKGPILYAPLKNLTARLNEGAAASLARYLYEKPLLPEDEPVIALLEDQGFFEAADGPSQELKPPTYVTLFPSDGCNLRCRYCYAAAEERKHRLSPEVAKAAVDLVAENAVKIGNSDFVVAFHGNGEPFTNFELIREICIYTKQKSEQTGLEGKLTIATNGVLSEEKLDWLVAWFDGANISCDILPDVQNRQRPFADGSGSYEYVDRTIRRLDEAGKNYGIRATVTSDSVERLTEIALLTAERYPHCQQLHIEPAWECGRCGTTGETTPDTELFISQFLAAQEAVADKGLKLVFSAARRGQITNRFCAASADSLVVTAEGLVTSCYEVCEKNDPRSDRFIYGYYDGDTGRFVLDGEKMKDLHRLTVENMPECRNCFCKYHCAGDCPAKRLGLLPPEEHQDSQRCRITRTLTLKQITAELDRAMKMGEETNGQQ